ncbi:hypothetical protein PIB30_052607, partial [Stylosanthes scabra]|nr:hypothetical protein [Stylosanthes scabra]
PPLEIQANLQAPTTRPDHRSPSSFLNQNQCSNFESLPSTLTPSLSLTSIDAASWCRLPPPDSSPHPATSASPRFVAVGRLSELSPLARCC